MRIINIHRRRIRASAHRIGELLDQIASPRDVLWPRGWPPMRFEGPVEVGMRGGHGPVRYHVSAHRPGRLLEMTFDLRTIEGTHTLTVEPLEDCGGEAALLSHEIDARASGSARVIWPLIIRPLHDALLEQLLDNAERSACGRLHGSPARQSLWVRMLRGASRLAAVQPRRGLLPSML